MAAVPVALTELAERVLRRRDDLRAATARGYSEALRQLAPLRDGPAIDPQIPPGMLQAIVAAGLVRDAAPLEVHYCRTMPALLAAQLRGRSAMEAKLFSARLDLRELPRLREGLERLFTLVADAGLSCAAALGESTPAALVAARPTLAHFYAGCHFGRSMPMLYAYSGDLAEEAWRGRTPAEFIDARYVGPLVHELSHLHPLDPELVPAPANLHEALAAWLGQRAWPASIWPADGEEDALPGGAFFASVGGWLARALGERGAIRAQGGALDLASAEEGLGPDCAAALRLYGFLPYLDTGAPHLLSDAFRPDRWWKLIDLHRDAALAERMREELAGPLLHEVPPAGARLSPRWDEWLDAVPLAALPCASEQPLQADHDLAELARRALLVRTERVGRRFVARRVPLELSLERGSCWLTSDASGPDAIGAPAGHPYPPALCTER